MKKVPEYLVVRSKLQNTEVVKEVSGYLRDQICVLALDIFHTLGASDYGRIDIRLDEFGTPHFLEANLLPSLIAGYGSFPKACLLNNNLDYDSMLLNIVNLALNRMPIDDEILIPPQFPDEAILLA